MLLADEAIFKEEFFTAIAQNKNHIITRLIKTQIDEKLATSIVDDSGDKTKDAIKASLDNIYKGIDLDKKWDECAGKIKTIIDNRAYDEALKYCCLEHGVIVSNVANKYVHDYVNVALKLLSENTQLAEKIRKKYLCEIELL